MPSPKVTSATSISQLIERFDDFKGNFSFDASADGTDALPNEHIRATSNAAKLPQGAVTGTPLFPAVDDLLGLFKDSCKELVNLRQKAGASEKPIAASQEISDVVKDSPHKRILGGFWHPHHTLELME